MFQVSKVYPSHETSVKIKLTLLELWKPDMVAHAFNPSTQKAEPDGSLELEASLGLQ